MEWGPCSDETLDLPHSLGKLVRSTNRARRRPPARSIGRPVPGAPLRVLATGLGSVPLAVRPHVLDEIVLAAEAPRASGALEWSLLSVGADVSLEVLEALERAATEVVWADEGALVHVGV